MRVLPDTSIWVSYFRHGRNGIGRGLDHLLQSGEVTVCGPVLAELLAGAKEERRSQLRTLLLSLSWAGMGTAEWLRAGEVAASLRAAGRTLPISDIYIAAAAVGASAALWTTDKDFNRIREVLPELTFRDEEIGIGR